MRLLVALSVLLRLCHTFSLDTRTYYWGYTTNSLAKTTSQQCKDAYSAEIHCDDYLLMLVNAHGDRRYLKHFAKANFTDTCTATCQHSLVEYISNVKASCSQAGDAALKGYGVLSTLEFAPVPVEIIGRVFQHTLMQACAKDEDDNYCYIKQSAIIPTDFDCDWTCDVAYHWNNHQNPYSEWEFGGADIPYVDEDGTRVNIINGVLFQHPVLFRDPDPAWTRLEECGFANATAPFDTGIEGVVDVPSSAAMKSSTSASASTGSDVSEISISLLPQPGGGGKIGLGKGWISVAVVLLALFLYSY